MGFEKSLFFGVLLALSSRSEFVVGSVHRLVRRQVPQEWAHASEVRTVDEMLKLDNPQAIVHPIFSLLGNQGATKGLGKVNAKNIDCFQKIVADQAFKNAKKAKNQKGQEAAIIFASLERNSQSIGKETPPCKSIKVDSPEIQRLIQHQDAAGGAKATENNKLSAKLAALSLKEIGSDPFLALRTGTFKPGDPKNSNKGAGFSCDDENDKEGCIYSKKLLVEDVTKAEIEEFLKKEGASSRSTGSNFKANEKDQLTDTTGDKDNKDNKDTRDNKENNDNKDTKDTKDNKDNKDNKDKDTKDTKDNKDKENKEKDNKENKDNKDNKDNKENKNKDKVKGKDNKDKEKNDQKK